MILILIKYTLHDEHILIILLLLCYYCIKIVYKILTHIFLLNSEWSKGSIGSIIFIYFIRKHLILSKITYSFYIDCKFYLFVFFSILDRCFKYKRKFLKKCVKIVKWNFHGINFSYLFITPKIMYLIGNFLCSQYVKLSFNKSDKSCKYISDL